MGRTPIKKIVTFGCSFTGGVPALTDPQGNCYNWPYMLAKETGWHVENYSFAGTCARFGMLNLEKFLNNKDYFTIFQIPSPSRLTHIIDDSKLAKARHQVLDNYTQYTELASHCLCNYQPAKAFTKSGSTVDSKIKKMYQYNIKYYPDVYTDLDYRIAVNYIHDNADLCFFHKARTDFDFPDIISMDKIFENEFNSFVFDAGQHFGKLGLETQAAYIRDLINDKL
jgi:hypothetical protein